MHTAKTASDPTSLAHRWTEMWNRARPAQDIVSADCRVYFGRKPPSNKDVGDPPESCAAKWSTSARASQHGGHDALVTAECA